MSSQKMRDQKTDHLLTPENSALIIIDYQPTQIGSIESMDKHTMVKNLVAVIKLAKLYKMPIVVSTVNVKAAGLKSTIPQIAQEVKDLPSYDRTSINAWEDIEFLEAVRGAKRKKLIMTALWTEACLLFPTLDALKEGYEVYPVVDAVAGTSLVAHDAALRRMEQAGAQPTSVMSLVCELQRDWARYDTVPAMLGVLAGIGNNVGLDIEGQSLEAQSQGSAR
ncbi:MAG: hydrolase [Bacteroidota bacterium]|nr:hydrolase [Bacteroidota bacterium]